MAKLVAAYGVRFTLPDDWSARVFPPKKDGAEVTGLNVHGASMAVSLADESTFGSAMMGELGPLDLGFILNESDPDSGTSVLPGVGRWSNEKPKALNTEAFSPATLQVTRPGQLGVQRAFTINGRLVDLYVVLGSIGAARSGLAGLGVVLQSFEAASSTTASDYVAS